MMLALADVQSGNRVLDLAAGTFRIEGSRYEA
jgi:hypothetical protein